MHTPKNGLARMRKKSALSFLEKYAEDGLSFLGCIELIMAEDEAKIKKIF